MARNAARTLTHRPKDFCTIEQAGYIAQLAVNRYAHAQRHNRWHRRLWRWLTAKVKG